MTNKINSFEDLIIWQKAQELAVKIYELADSNKFIGKDFSLKDQLKSAAISISDNIAEGFEYNNNPDFHRFLRIAREINNSMPNYTVELLQDALNNVGMPMKGTKVGILGISYKANVDDVRESPAIKVISLPKNMAPTFPFMIRIS